MDTYEKRNLLEKSYQSAVHEAWKQFIANKPIREKDIPPHILRSWKLSREAGMDPLNPQVPPVLDKRELASLCRQHQTLIDSAKPILDMLEVSIRDTGYIAILAVASGHLLAAVGDDNLLVQARSQYNIPGAQRSIKTIGASALSMSIVERAPIQLGPALAEGNSVILKPASVTSLSTLKLAEFAAEAGIPEGVFNVITGPGSSVGEALGLHPGVDVVSFTGSTEVGRRFLEYAARSNLKRIVLELGGKSPFVVLDDVTDYAAVAAQAAAAAFWNMGENCTANSRIIVPRKRKDAFTEALLAELGNWRIGDPLDPENNLGSIVSEGQFRTIMGYIEKGKDEGGHVLTGGAPLAIGSGLFIPPTIFDGVTPDMTIVREEIFGPVTAILPADSDEEAVGLANATAYGLQATLFTEDVTKAHKYARALKAGTVSVNCFSEGDNTTPFGGYKLSGFGGKDKGRESHDQYTETKTIFLNLDR